MNPQQDGPQTPQERSALYREAAAIAKRNASILREMAIEYPDECDVYMKASFVADARAEHYDRLAALAASMDQIAREQARC